MNKFPKHSNRRIGAIISNEYIYWLKLIQELCFTCTYPMASKWQAFDNNLMPKGEIKFESKSFFYILFVSISMNWFDINVSWSNKWNENDGSKCGFTMSFNIKILLTLTGAIDAHLAFISTFWSSNLLARKWLSVRIYIHNVSHAIAWGRRNPFIHFYGTHDEEFSVLNDDDGADNNNTANMNSLFWLERKNCNGPSEMRCHCHCYCEHI